MKLNPTKIMKIKRNGFARVLLASFLCLAMLLSPLSMRAAYAAENDAGEDPDPLRIGSFSVTFEFYNETTGNKEPVTGGNSVGLFKVADVVYVDQVGWRFKADSRFAEIGEFPGTSEELDEQNLDLAEELEIMSRGYDFDYGPKEMNSEGEVYFDELPVGLYLVMQAAQSKDSDKKFVIAPFLVSIPLRDKDGTLIYDVTANAKPVGVAKEELPPPPPPEPPHDRVPQTGQLWWPVMAFGAAGVLLVCAGLLRKSKRQ